MNLCFTESIEGYPAYLITKDGRVISLTRRVPTSNGGTKIVYGRVLKPSPVEGYPSVSLVNEDGKKTLTIHRLVAQAFIPNPDNLPQVDHKNAIKHDNRLSNLHWVTVSENNQRSYDVSGRSAPRNMVGRFSERNPWSRPVKQFSLDGDLIKRWNCGMDAERDGGFSSSCISLCCRKKNKTHKGFIWDYANA